MISWFTSDLFSPEYCEERSLMEWTDRIFFNCFLIENYKQWQQRYSSVLLMGRSGSHPPPQIFYKFRNWWGELQVEKIYSLNKGQRFKNRNHRDSFRRESVTVKTTQQLQNM